MLVQQEDEGLKLAALTAGSVIYSSLFVHLCPVFFLLLLPRVPAPSLGTPSTSLETPSTSLETPSPSPGLDLPPGYDSLLDSQLPGYEDSFVQKEAFVQPAHEPICDLA